MKKWYASQPSEIRFLLQFVCSFFIILSFLIFVREPVSGETPHGWPDYFLLAFVCSFVLEICSKYIFFIPGYFKKQDKNGAQA
jgi:hypothetical protein